MKKSFFITLITAIFLMGMSSAFAGDLVVTRYFSGLWEQPHQESQGIVLQVIDQEEEGMPKAVAYWFTYGEDQLSAWHMAIGHVEGDSIPMILYSAEGVDFMQEAVGDLNPVEQSGQLTLTFHNCNKGEAEYTLNGEDGSFEIRRLAGLYNGRCTGGISDNTPGDAKPLMLEVALLPPEGSDSEAKGKAKFWERSDRSDFHVSAEYLVDGEYEIFVCEERVGALTVEEGEGATQFRSPEAEGKLNLTFDPRDCRIDIVLGDIVLTSGDRVLGDKIRGPKDEGNGDKMKLELEFENLGVEGYGDAEGEVEYEVAANERELEIEIEDMPAGVYDLVVVNAALVFSIEVNASGKGKLKFSEPVVDDRLPLEFDPMGDTFNVVNADGILLTVTFPDP